MTDERKRPIQLVVTEDLNKRISKALLALFGIPILLLVVIQVSANGEGCGGILSPNDRLFFDRATELACAEAVSARKNLVVVLGVIGIAVHIARSLLLDVVPTASDPTDEG